MRQKDLGEFCYFEDENGKQCENECDYGSTYCSEHEHLADEFDKQEGLKK